MNPLIDSQQTITDKQKAQRAANRIRDILRDAIDRAHQAHALTTQIIRQNPQGLTPQQIAQQFSAEERQELRRLRNAIKALVNATRTDAITTPDD